MNVYVGFLLAFIAVVHAANNDIVDVQAYNEGYKTYMMQIQGKMEAGHNNQAAGTVIGDCFDIARANIPADSFITIGVRGKDVLPTNTDLSPNTSGLLLFIWERGVTGSFSSISDDGLGNGSLHSFKVAQEAGANPRIPICVVRQSDGSFPVDGRYAISLFLTVPGAGAVTGLAAPGDGSDVDEGAADVQGYTIVAGLQTPPTQAATPNKSQFWQEVTWAGQVTTDTINPGGANDFGLSVPRVDAAGNRVLTAFFARGWEGTPLNFKSARPAAFTNPRVRLRIFEGTAANDGNELARDGDVPGLNDADQTIWSDVYNNDATRPNQYGDDRDAFVFAVPPRTAATSCLRISAGFAATGGNPGKVTVDVWIAIGQASLQLTVQLCHSVGFTADCTNGGTALAGVPVQRTGKLSGTCFAGALGATKNVRTPVNTAANGKAIMPVWRYHDHGYTHPLQIGAITFDHSYENNLVVTSAPATRNPSAITAATTWISPLAKKRNYPITLVYDQKGDGATGDNTPLNNVQVFLFQGTTDRTPAGQATTDAQGQVTIVGIVPGTDYTVRIGTFNGNAITGNDLRSGAGSSFTPVDNGAGGKQYRTAAATIASATSDAAVPLTRINGYLYRGLLFRVTPWLDENGNGLQEAAETNLAALALTFKVPGVADQAVNINTAVDVPADVTNALSGPITAASVLTAETAAGTDFYITNTATGGDTTTANSFLRQTGAADGRVGKYSAAALTTANFAQVANTRRPLRMGIVQSRTLTIEFQENGAAVGAAFTMPTVANIAVTRNGQAVPNDGNHIKFNGKKVVITDPQVQNDLAYPGVYVITISNIDATYSVVQPAAGALYTIPAAQQVRFTVSLTTAANQELPLPLIRPILVRLFTYIDLNFNGAYDNPAELNSHLDRDALRVQLFNGDTELTTEQISVLASATADGKRYIPIQVKPAGTDFTTVQFDRILLTDQDGARKLLPFRTWRANPSADTEQILISGNVFRLTANGIANAGTFPAAAAAAGATNTNGAVSGHLVDVNIQNVPGDNTFSYQIMWINGVNLIGTTYLDADGSGGRNAGESSLPAAEYNTGNANGKVRVAGTVGGNAIPALNYIDSVNGEINTWVPAGVWNINVGDVSTNYFITGTTTRVRNIAGNIATTQNIGTIGFYKLSTLQAFAWRDANRDGLSNGDSGLSPITVSVTDNANRAVAVQASLNTLATGKVTFPNVHPGTYTVKFSAVANLVFAPVTGGGSNVDSNGEVTVSVRSGTNTNVPVEARAAYQLPGRINDFRVFHDLNGNGIQEAGEPGVSTGVTLLGPNGAVNGNTNTQGLITFDGLNSGSYTIRVNLPSGAAEFSPANQGTNDAIDSDVGTSGEVTVDISGTNSVITNVAAGLYFLNSFSVEIFNDRNGNGVQDNGDEGFSGQRLFFTRSDGRSFERTTGDNGRADFDDLLAPGTWTLSTNVGSTLAITTGFPTNGRQTYTIISQQAQVPLLFGMAEAQNVKIAIFHDENGNGQRDNTEGGFSGLQVRLVQATGSSTTATATTGPNGEVQFNNLFPAVYQVRLETTGKQRVSPGSSQQFNADNVATVTVQSRVRNEDRTAGAYVLSGPLIVRVYNDTNSNGAVDEGEPFISEVSVILFLDRPEPSRKRVFTQLASGKTSDNGLMQFTDLVPGKYQVYINFGDPFQMTVPGANNAFDVTGKQTLTITSGTNEIFLQGGLNARTVLFGKVTDDLDNPVPGARVGVWRNGIPFSVITPDADGSYRVDPMPPGIANIVFTSPPNFFVYNPPGGTVDVDIPSGDITNVNAKLTRYPSNVLPNRDAQDPNSPGDVFVPVAVIANDGQDRAFQNTGPGLSVSRSRAVLPAGEENPSGYHEGDYWSFNNYGSDNTDALISPDIFSGASTTSSSLFLALLALVLVLAL